MSHAGIAFAGEPRVDPAGGLFPFNFMGAGNESEIRVAGQPAIKCKVVQDNGRFNAPPLGQVGSSTGEITLIFEACKDVMFGFVCTTPGQPAGIIWFNLAVFYTTCLTDNKTTPGILITPPPAGVFANVNCGGFVALEIKGTGVMGDLTKPKCGAEGELYEASFTAAGNVQTFKQVTGTGALFNLVTTINGAMMAETALVTALPLNLAGGEEAKLTCV